MENNNNKLLFSAGLLVVAAAFTRLFPHPYNFTAIGAMAVFGGSVIRDKKLAFLLPLAALLLSDVCLQLFTATRGFYGITQVFVYAAFIIITALSTLMKKRSAATIAFAAIWSGVIFFILSNVGVWLSDHLYSKNIPGLLACFAAAIPFYKNEVFGNFALNAFFGNAFYLLVLFGAYAWIEKTDTQKTIA